MVTRMTDLPTLIQTACAIKEQMHAQIGALYARLGTNDWSRVEHEDVARVLKAQYAPAIDAIVAATTPEDLERRRDRLNDRLDAGWDYCDTHAENVEAMHAWVTLLTEYEVINDALNHIGVINGTLDRIDWIAALQPPDAALVQGRLA